MKNTYNTLKKLYPELIDPKIAEIRLFHFIRQEGSHVFLRHKDKRTTTVPVHPGEKLDRGLLNKIIKKDLKISREEFEKYL